MSFFRQVGLMLPWTQSALREVREASQTGSRLLTYMGSVAEPRKVVVPRTPIGEVIAAPIKVRIGGAVGEEGGEPLAGVDKGRMKEFFRVSAAYDLVCNTFAGLKPISGQSMTIAGVMPTGLLGPMEVHRTRVSIASLAELSLMIGALRVVEGGLTRWIEVHEPPYSEAAPARSRLREEIEEMARGGRVSSDVALARRIRGRSFSEIVPILEAMEWSAPELAGFLLRFRVREVLPVLFKSFLAVTDRAPFEDFARKVGSDPSSVLPYVIAAVRDELHRGNFPWQTIEAAVGLGKAGIPLLRFLLDAHRNFWLGLPKGGQRGETDEEMYVFPWSGLILDAAVALGRQGLLDDARSYLRDFLVPREEIDEAKRRRKGARGLPHRSLCSHNLDVAVALMELGEHREALEIYRGVRSNWSVSLSETTGRLPYLGDRGRERREAREEIDWGTTVIEIVLGRTKGRVSNPRVVVLAARSKLDVASFSPFPEDRKRIREFALGLLEDESVNLEPGHALTLALWAQRVMEEGGEARMVELLKRVATRVGLKERDLARVSQMLVDMAADAGIEFDDAFVRELLQSDDPKVRLEGARQVVAVLGRPGSVPPLKATALRGLVRPVLYLLLNLQSYERATPGRADHVRKTTGAGTGVLMRPMDDASIHLPDAQEIRAEASFLLDEIEPGWDRTFQTNFPD